ncbi:MAG: hypothetical protein Q8W51_08830 [Candidatus Palauibacterales bacterium]|nr:hypothetical protein [Candidatus Palauibacterales bacterium]MDP2584346.1 hypothetical protein [Candidatus Palauibacterales bacterium]
MIQAQRADSIQVEVSPAVAASDGRVRYSYDLRSMQASVQYVEIFGLEVAKRGVTSVRAPQGWRAFFPWQVQAWSRYFPRRAETDRVLVWANVDNRRRLGPGGTAEGFGFDTNLLPGLTLNWTKGLIPVPTFPEEAMPDSTVGASLFENSVSDTTIGPAVPPEAADEPDEILRQMSTLLDFSCRRGWIDNHGICNSLSKKLQHVHSSVADGNDQAASGQLGAFRHELSAQRGKHVSESAFGALDLYAGRLAERLQAP